jgi:drug/metabolite transporter (DMT)-like permease
MTTTPRRLGDPTIPAFAALVALIGTNLVAIRIGNRELAPLWHAGLRFLVAAALFWLIALVRTSPRPTRRAAVGAALYGLLSIAAFFGFVYAGLVEVSVGLATTTLALGPLITLGLAAAIGLERIRAAAVVGAAIAFGGISLMYASALSRDVPVSALLLIVAAACSFAAGGIVVKRTPPIDAVVQNAVASSVGAVVLVGLSIVAGERLAIPGKPETWIAFAYLVIPGTILTFGILLYLLHRWPASRVAYQFVLAPIVAIAVAAVLLDESIEPPVLVGTVLVLIGVWIGALRSTAARVSAVAASDAAPVDPAAP